jgi:hypothetical protein
MFEAMALFLFFLFLAYLPVGRHTAEYLSVVLQLVFQQPPHVMKQSQRPNRHSPVPVFFDAVQ